VLKGRTRPSGASTAGGGYSACRFGAASPGRGPSGSRRFPAFRDFASGPGASRRFWGLRSPPARRQLDPRREARRLYAENAGAPWEDGFADRRASSHVPRGQSDTSHAARPATPVLVGSATSTASTGAAPLGAATEAVTWTRRGGTPHTATAGRREEAGAPGRSTAAASAGRLVAEYGTRTDPGGVTGREVVQHGVAAGGVWTARAVHIQKRLLWNRAAVGIRLIGADQGWLREEPGNRVLPPPSVGGRAGR